MFSVHTTPEEFKNAAITSHFGFVFQRNTRSGKSPDYRDTILFEKLRFQHVFFPHENEKPVFSNSSGLKSVFEKLRFGDGLVWTGGLTVELAAFSNSSGLGVDGALCMTVSLDLVKH